MSARRMKIAFLAVLALLSLWGRATSHNWGDDFAQYVSQACNLAQGVPAENTGYLWGPKNYVGPPSYPNAFPWLLAPLCKLYGPKIRPMMDLMSGFYFVFILSAVYFLRTWLSLPIALLLGCLIATNRWINDFKIQVLSDLPGSAALLGALTLVIRERKRLLTNPPSSPESWRRALTVALGTGALFGFAYQLRTSAVVLLPAVGIFFLWDFWRRPELRRALAGSAAAFLGGTALLIVLIRSPSPEGYMSVGAYGEHVRVNLHHYWMTFMEVVPTWSVPVARMKNDVWSKADGFYLRLILGWGLLAVAAIGLVKKMRREPGIEDAFFFTYFAMLIAPPFVQNFRYLLPVYPVFLLYFVGGFRTLSGWSARAWPSLGPGIRRAAITAALLLVSHGLWQLLTTREFRSRDLNDGPQHIEAVQAFEYIQENLPQDAVIVFRKPRALALYTGRKTTGIPIDGASFEEVDAFYRSIGVTYIMEDHGQPTRLTEYLKWLGDTTPTLWRGYRFSLRKFYADEPRAQH